MILMILTTISNGYYWFSTTCGTGKTFTNNLGYDTIKAGDGGNPKMIYISYQTIHYNNIIRQQLSNLILNSYFILIRLN